MIEMWFYRVGNCP